MVERRTIGSRPSSVHVCAEGIRLKLPGCPVDTISTACAFHLLPAESGKFWLMETLLAPLPVACAPPPRTRLPEGQVATTLFEFAELDEVDASTRSSPLTPGEPFGPGKPRGPAGPGGPAGPVGELPRLEILSEKSSVLHLTRPTALAASLSTVTASFFSFGVVTAPFLILAVVTLPSGTLSTAAEPVPPSAMPSARQATTRAADGGRSRVLRMFSSFS